MNIAYTEKTQMLMQLHYGRLSEKDRRQYAAVEAEKLGRGGLAYISNLLGIDHKTIQRGKKELLAMAEGHHQEMVPCTRQRKAGGGRKKNGKRSRNQEITA